MKSFIEIKRTAKIMGKKSSKTLIFFLLIGFILLSTKHVVPKTEAQNPPPQKLLLAVFYWWYPWYGAQWRDPPGTGPHRPAVDVNGYLRQDAFVYQFVQPIPFLKSSERPNGLEDSNNRLAINWFKGNFERAANFGIDVLTPMVSPALEETTNQLKNMIQAQKELKNEGRKYPKLMLHLDMIELWERETLGTGDLTGPGPEFDAVWRGIKIMFDAIFATLQPEEIHNYFQTYPNSDSFPVFVYRLEPGQAYNYSTNNWWVTQLKLNFAQTYPNKNIYLILDEWWCNKNYGDHIITNSCNADNYYYWGGAVVGTQKSQYNKPPVIYTVGPGFNNSKAVYPPRVVPREDGAFFQRNLDSAKNNGANWILLETFNFGEEGTAIDETVEFSNQYLKITKLFNQNWKPIDQSPVNLSGKVINSITGEGIPGVEINRDYEVGCYIGKQTTDVNGNFSFPNVPFGQLFCLRTPPLIGYRGPGISYECQIAGKYAVPDGCGRNPGSDMVVDNQYNFTYTLLSISLNEGWNEITWPAVTGIKASDIPPECPITVAKENFWFKPYVRNFGGVNFNFEKDTTYFLKCNQAVIWNL